MIGELILHLGDFRTGTTTIQRWLRAHGPAQGIHYPPGFNHADLVHSLSDPAARTARFRAMADDLATAQAPFAVISAEHFEFADPAILAAALAAHMPRHKLRLIAYVRPHPQALVARFTESAKIGSFDGDLASYLDWPPTLRRMTYAPRFSRWREVFGPAFTLRLYDRGGFPGGDVLRDFAGFVTGTDPGPQAAKTNATPGHETNATPTREANASPGLEALARARAFHRALGPLPDAATVTRWTLGRHLGRQLAELALPQTPLRLHKSLAERLVSTFEADAATTDAAFFDGTPLSRALAAAPGLALEDPQSLAPEDHLHPQALQAITLWGQMLRHALIAPDGADTINRLYHE